MYARLSGCLWLGPAAIDDKSANNLWVAHRSTPILREWLDSEDRVSRAGRVKRLRFLLNVYGPERRWQFVPGGTLGLQAFKESRLCYLNGCYVASVCAAQVAIEQTLAGLFAMESGDAYERAGFAQLLSSAVDSGYITSEEYAAFDQIRQRRNTYIHFRRPMDPGTPNRRAVEAQLNPEAVYRADAELALGALCGLFARPPFAVLEDS